MSPADFRNFMILKAQALDERNRMLAGVPMQWSELTVTQSGQVRETMLAFLAVFGPTTTFELRRVKP